MRLAVGAERSVRLLEVSDAALAKALAAGDALCIKGGPGDAVVLCTAHESFLVREVHTSNLLALVASAPDAEPCQKRQCIGGGSLDTQSAVIEHRGGTVLEATRFAGRLDRLQRLLAEAPRLSLRAGAGGLASAGPLPELQEKAVFASVQASDAAISAFLAQAGAVLVDDHYCLPDVQYVRLFLRCLFIALADKTAMADLAAAVERESAGAVSVGAAQQLLCQYVVEGSVSVEKVSMFYAAFVAADRPDWTAAAFLRTWREAIERDMAPFQPSVQSLSGGAFAVVNGTAVQLSSVPESALGAAPLLFLPAASLPWTSDAGARLAALFGHAPRWELPALEALVEPVARALGGRVSAPDLIVRHARVSTDDRTGARVVTPLLRSL